MSSGVRTWSKTPASNATADGSINLRDNQAPSVVKTNNRQIMSDIAAWRDDLNGSLTTTGTSTAYAVTTNQDVSAETDVPDGFEFAAIIHVDCGDSPTIAIDGHTAKPITYKTGFAPISGMLELGSFQRFRYFSSSGECRMMGVISRDGNKTGVEQGFYGSSLPAGYVWANGNTIGNASSNATGRANADTANLFSALWTAFANAELPIVDSAGSLTSRGGSAASDYAANKALPVPDRRDRAAIGKGTMGGTSAAGRVANTSPVSIDTSTLGKTGGVDRITLDTTMIPAHTHTGTTDGHHHTYDWGGNKTATNPGNGNQVQINGSTQSTSTATDTFTTASTGGGGAHNNMIPVIVCNVIIKL